MKQKPFSFVVSFVAEFKCTFQPENFYRLKNQKCWKSAEPKVLSRLTLSGTSGLMYPHLLYTLKRAYDITEIKGFGKEIIKTESRGYWNEGAYFLWYQ